MDQTKKKPLLNRKETQSTLNTIKVITTAGAISMTVAGWGLLALIDARNAVNAQAAQADPSVAVAAPPSGSGPAAQPSNHSPSNVPTIPTPTPQPANQLDIVQWVQDNAGDQIAVVRDNRGTLWYVMGSDVPRIEAGQQPEYQPVPVRTTTRSRAS